ncbi:MAG: EAL domain-containing protein [Wenzhouxiangellaceae bacterium]|nr:EAL domain-containing protein [Wenzhouxiangellaceae bacterium]
MTVAVGILDALAAGRAYVSGESEWSKAHHSAIFHLDRFAESGDAEELALARQMLEIPLADRAARKELTSARPDRERARNLLIQGGNHERDASRLIRFFDRFNRWSPFSAAMDRWAEADVWIMRLDQLADELERLWQRPESNSEQIASIRSEMALINKTLNDQARQFSDALDQGSRWLSARALWISLGLLALLVALLVALFIWALRGVRRSQGHFWNTFENAPVGMALLDSNGRMFEINDSLSVFFGRGLEELLQTPLTDYCDVRDRALTRRTMAESERTSRPLNNLESRYLRPDGNIVWGKLSIAPLGAQIEGSDIHVAVVENISESRSLAAELAYQAAHDQLTGLPNRRDFERELNKLLNGMASGAGRHAVGMIDLDQFKVINDTFGHLAGDALLVRLAERIQHCLRDDDLLARLDGDEFGLILRDCGLETAAQVANRLRDVIAQFRFSWEERPVNVSASIGIVEVNGTNRDSAVLLQKVDLACHEAKDLGRNQVCVHAENKASSVKRRQEMSWVNQINQAVASNRLRFHAQLIAPSAGDEWRCELLVRLEDADGRLHTAQLFMEAAERYHVARTIDQWVISNALKVIGENASRFPRIATWHINLSGQSVDCELVLPELIAQIDTQGIDPGQVCFEITESSAIHSLEEAQSFFSALRDLGCQVALDDFGKGLSTFDYLKQLPVDLVKIDGGFVRELAHSELDHAMVRSIHEVARIAGKKTVAESVESIELIIRLRQIGIDFLQGHAVHTPEPLSSMKIPDLDLIDENAG